MAFPCSARGCRSRRLCCGGELVSALFGYEEIQAAIFRQCSDGSGLGVEKSRFDLIALKDSSDQFGKFDGRWRRHHSNRAVATLPVFAQ